MKRTISLTVFRPDCVEAQRLAVSVDVVKSADVWTSKQQGGWCEIRGPTLKQREAKKYDPGSRGCLSHHSGV